MTDVIFGILSLFAITGAIGMIYFANTVHSALSFIVTVMALAGLYALLSAPFLFMVQIIIYAGAIIALLLFIIMFLNIGHKHVPKEPNKLLIMLATALVLIPVDFLLLKAFATVSNVSNFDKLTDSFGTIDRLGTELFKGWLVPFEIISILLLVALIGSIVLARKEERE
ncbi:MAG: NADH-quinone oxidoreductase subunit J [Sulfurospirillaceae bacterium]|nr:NADH-quinone oxidoreductase subunit J [Sulfurospirillaceae bacterium]